MHKETICVSSYYSPVYLSEYTTELPPPHCRDQGNVQTPDNSGHVAYMYVSEHISQCPVLDEIRDSMLCPKLIIVRHALHNRPCEETKAYLGKLAGHIVSPSERAVIVPYNLQSTRTQNCQTSNININYAKTWLKSFHMLL